QIDKVVGDLPIQGLDRVLKLGGEFGQGGETGRRLLPCLLLAVATALLQALAVPLFLAGLETGLVSLLIGLVANLSARGVQFGAGVEVFSRRALRLGGSISRTFGPRAFQIAHSPALPGSLWRGRIRHKGRPRRTARYRRCRRGGALPAEWLSV